MARLSAPPMNAAESHDVPLPSKGFTLIEVLVAVAVLAIVLVLLLAISSGTLATTRRFHQRMDASAEGRGAIDALSGDLANAVMRQGGAIFARQAAPLDANAEIAIVTQGRGATADSRFMSVGYQLDDHGNLNRYSDVVRWNDQNLSEKAVDVIAKGHFSRVGRGVLRFSVIVILDNGAIVPLTDSSVHSSWKVPVAGAPTSFFALNFFAETSRRVRSLTIGIVGTDEQNYRLLNDMGKVDEVIAAFPAPESVGDSITNTPADWAAKLATRSNPALQSLPSPIVAALQVTQYTYSVR